MCETESSSCLTIEDLDNDVLLIIMSSLDFIDKVRAERVCKRWKDLIDYTLSLQTCLYFSDKNDFDVELSCPIAEYNAKPTEVIELSKLITFDYLLVLGNNELSQWDEAAEEIMNGAIKKCPNLKKIGLIDYLRLESPLRLICDNCHHSLEAIDLIGFRKISMTVHDMKRVGEKYPNLSYIRAVTSNLLIAEECLKTLFQSCLNLKSFIIHSDLIFPPSWTEWGRSGQYHRINGDCYAYMSDTIREIRTDIKIMNNNGLISLCQSKGGPNLTTLDLSGGTWDGWWFQIIAQGLPKLQVLRCSKVSVFSSDDLDDIALISELKHLRELHLDLSSKSLVLDLDDVVYGVMQSCSQMIRFELFNAYLTDRSLVHISKYWTQLSHLLLSTQMNPNITGECVQSISELKHLKYINFNGTKVCDSFARVCQMCSQLNDINLEYTLITNKTVEAVIEAAIKRPLDWIELDIAGTDTDIHGYTVPSNLKIYV